MERTQLAQASGAAATSCRPVPPLRSGRTSRELRPLPAHCLLSLRSAYELGVIHAALGDLDAAFKWLALAVQKRSGWIAYVRADPRLDRLHTDPRFTPLIPAA